MGSPLHPAIAAVAANGGNPNQFTASREDLPGLYREVLLQNPLLARIEGALSVTGWTDEEIRTFQLLAACRSNASLTLRLKEIENRIAVIHR